MKREYLTKAEFEKAKKEDIDPLKYAGEGWFATEEYARPNDIHDKYVKADVMREGEYYPSPANEDERMKRLKRRY